MKIINLLLFLFTFSIADSMGEDCVAIFDSRYPNFSSFKATNKTEQDFNLGFSNTTGDSRHLDINTKYNFASSTTFYDDRLIKIIFDTSLFFTQTDEIKTNEEYLLNLGVEQALDEEWLSYFILNWLRNPEFKNYEHKTSLGVGLGKDLFSDSSQSLTVKLGTSYSKENYANNQKSENFTSLNEYLEYKNQLNKISKLYLKTGLLQHFQDFENDYEILALLGANFSVGEKIHLTLEQEIAYDNLPPIGFKTTNTKSIVRLGYQF